MSILSIPIYQSQILIAIYDSNFQEGKEYSLSDKNKVSITVPHNWLNRPDDWNAGKSDWPLPGITGLHKKYIGPLQCRYYDSSANIAQLVFA